MTETDLELTDQEFEDYLSVALANGFSKGTANVSPADLKRLRPLMDFYRKKPHPFRACVADNRKRFGANTEKYCAVLKDLIVGSTKWRGKKKGLSDSTLKELFGLEVDRDFVLFLSELTQEEIDQMTVIEETEEKETDLAQGDIAWEADQGYNYLKTQIEMALNGGDTADYESAVGYNYWVSDLTKDRALVCEKGKDYYVIGYTLNKGNVELDQEQDWKPVTKAWVEEKVSLSEPVMAEMFFAATVKSDAKKEKDGLVWKTILREGQWKFSPSGGKAVKKTLTVTKDGVSSADNLIISMSELKKNFENGIVEHVTIPTSHEDKVTENTGYIKKLRIAKDEKGRAILEAGMEFTEPDIKGRVERGSIANTSAGVLFDYIHKEQGKKFNSVLAHAALTNRPWINGMKPFGVQASEGVEIIHFSEEINEDPANAEGGVSMSDLTFDLSEFGFENEEQLRAALSEAEALRKKDRERDIADKCGQWRKDGKTPAVIAEAEAIMMADSGKTVLNLSEGKIEVPVTVTEIVERLVNASASVKLDQDVVSDEASTGDAADESEEKEVSHDVKVLANEIYFGENLSYPDAIKEAQRRVAANS